jgi:hypothetical protein
MREGVAREGWDSVDIWESGIVGVLPANALTSAADPERVGSLGWYEHACHDLRVRLLVMVAGSAPDLAAARAVAHRLVARGGPAVLVLPHSADDFLNDVYAEIVHDRPLDWIDSLAWADHPAWTLYADATRAEALRVSTPLRALVEFSESLASGDAAPSRQLERLGRELPLDGAVLRSRWFRASDDVRDEWPRASFNLHESEGLLPMQRAVRRMRRRLDLPKAAVPPRGPRRTGPLVVTPRLFQAASNGSVRAVAQLDDVLHPGRPVLLGLGVGPHDELVEVARAAALLQEAVFPTPDAEGAWLDVVVVGLGTPVAGERTQRLWVPRTGVSDQVTFRLDVGRRESWRVRVCLYRDNLLLQAMLVSGISGLRTGSESREILGRQLGLDSGEVPGPSPCWYARVEYTLVEDDSSLDIPRAPRQLNVTANKLDGTRRLLFKGDDVTVDVRLSPATDDQVGAARADLAYVATPPRPNGKVAYGFEDDNTATPDYYRDAMVRLAARGWSLYESLVPQDARTTVGAMLQGHNGSIVSVGQLLVQNVLPWSMVYDRPFDKRSQSHDKLACQALLSDNELPDACGQLEVCPLSPHQRQVREMSGAKPVTEDTVVCPRHFWGFRHIVEIPVTRRAATVSMVRPSGPLNAGFGQHDDLYYASTHIDDLVGLVSGGHQPPPWRHGNRDKLRQSILTELDIDLLYLYCHAGYDDPDPDPVLRVKDASDPMEGLIAAGDLAGAAFRSQPFVFINGCRTAGFSPKALSPFLTTLVTDRNASGLVGTEIDVWEQLAVEVGRAFLDRLCNQPGMTAGRALRETRLDLLKKGNPLGLAYTLYALADLRLRP